MYFFKVKSFIVLTVNIIKLPKPEKKLILTFVIFSEPTIHYPMI